MHPLKRAAIAGVVLVILYVISWILNLMIPLSMRGVLSIIIILFQGIASLVFLSGFYYLGKKYQSKQLKIMTIYFMIVAIILFIISSIFSIYLNNKILSLQQEFSSLREKLVELNKTYNLEQELPPDVREQLKVELSKTYTSTLKPFLQMILKFAIIFYIVGILFYGIPKIFFGIGLGRLEKKVKYAKPAALLDIIGGATTIILIGYFLFFISFIFKIILLFTAAKKQPG